MGPRNAYKDMLDNVVSPITCVSMNHQNQPEQMWGHVRYTLFTFGCCGCSLLLRSLGGVLRLLNCNKKRAMHILKNKEIT
jgi:hypothetical protein